MKDAPTTINSTSLMVLAMIGMPPTSQLVGDRLRAIGDWPATVAILREKLLVEGHGVDLKLSPRGRVLLDAMTQLPLPERVEEWRIPS